MSNATSRQQIQQVLSRVHSLSITTNPAPEALFMADEAGFQVWCTPYDHPKGWDKVEMIAGDLSKPCEYVGRVSWLWDERLENIIGLTLSTDAYALGERAGGYRPRKHHNRPDDIAWLQAKITWLFSQTGLPTPQIYPG